MVLGALGALAGLYALGNSITWLQAMAEERSWGFLVMAAFGVLGSLFAVALVPLTFFWRRPPLAARIAIGVVGAVGGVCAAVCLWFVAMLQACLGEGVCRPVHTWLMLPALLACGVLSALGPTWGALTGDRNTTRQWALAIVLALAGFLVALGFWVEMGLYPG